MLKKYNLLDELNNINDKTIENIISIDNRQKLKEARKMEREEKKMKRFNFVPVLAGAMCAVAICGVVVTNKIGTKEIINEREQIGSPILEVENKEEMKKYLGFEVPNVEEKEVETYIVVGFDDYADLARIIFKDESEFRMARVGYENISGIYGAKLEKTEKINGVDVEFYLYENMRFASWKTKEFEYSYTTNVDDANITEFVTKLVSIVE